MLSERLSKLRSVAGVSGRELSALAGLSAATVHLLETGKRKSPEVETCRRIMAGIGLPEYWGWLATGEGAGPSDDEISAGVATVRALSRTGSD